MEIEGPLNISVQYDDETSPKRELHLSFKPAFIQQKVFERIETMQSYMDHLKHHLQKLSHDDPDRPGIETIYQICENLLENIRLDELDLNETIVLEIQPTVNISNFLTGHSTIN